jgi:hypothetical protein
LAALIREDLVTTIGVDTAGLTPGDKSAPRLWRATDLLRGPTTLAATPCNEPGAGQTHDGARAEAPGAGTAPRATAPPIHTESITETPP